MQMALCWHFKEVSVRAKGKTLPQEPDKTMISRAFPRRSFSEIGVLAEGCLQLPPRHGEVLMSSTSTTTHQKLGDRR